MDEGGRSDNRAPPFSLLAREAMALALPIFAPILPPVICTGDGAGASVLVFPGLLSSDATTSRLRRTLDAAGFRSSGWELGFNIGLRPGLLEACVRRLVEVASKAERKVILLGWSLGGLYAREIAKQRPDLVLAVVTLASPFSDNPHANNGWRVYEWLNDHPVDKLPLDTDLSVKPPVSTIAIWSREDGIVSPASAKGVLGETDRTFEISSTHMGMGVSAHAIREVVAILMSLANLEATSR